MSYGGGQVLVLHRMNVCKISPFCRAITTLPLNVSPLNLVRCFILRPSFSYSLTALHQKLKKTVEGSRTNYCLGKWACNSGEKYWYCRCWLLIASLRSLWKDAFQSKKTPCSRRLIVKLYTLFKTQDIENHTLFSGTNPYMPNKRDPPLHLPWWKTGIGRRGKSSLKSMTEKYHLPSSLSGIKCRLVMQDVLKKLER